MPSDAARSVAPLGRPALTRERILNAAVMLADEAGLAAVSMRRVGQDLGVEAMSLYNHVANKDDLLTGMVDVVVAEIERPRIAGDWRQAVRAQARAARVVLARHPWAPPVIETRSELTPTLLGYMDGVLGILLEGGFTPELAHHALHALGSRLLGFSQELFDDSAGGAASPESGASMWRTLQDYPHLARMLGAIEHRDHRGIGSGCDDDAEFLFALDLLLDGLERLRVAD